MSKSYHQIIDGEWFTPSKRGFKEQCCDCGLVHKVDFRVVDNQIQFRCSRDERSTAAVRRAFKFEKDK